jgi:quinol monooxygenase YgiN
MKARLFVLVFSMALISNTYGNMNTKEKTKDSSNSVQTAATVSGMMIIANVTVKPDKVKAFTEAAKEIIEKSNKEAGCKSYQLFQDPYNNSKFVFVEEYKDQAAIDAHFASDYFKAFGPKIGDLVAEPAKIRIITVSNVVNK